MSKQPYLTPPQKPTQVVAATRIYGRSPEWKVYPSLGLARQSIAYGIGTMEIKDSSKPIGIRYEDRARPGELWILVDGEWKLDWHCPLDKEVSVKDLPWKK